ncbi:hypothetical protein KUTeg_001688 [Tegillarca granosa]|uniref:Uncharacterized protein n=1 Tax=Tegillarca granosa TaxID=220873 RepID=A0ABQ9FTM5_TEGGR|nr:hypothetical protein KUTeg_001688 [Tegillarca granosa]
MIRRGTREEWQIIFFICVGVAVAGSIMFAMFGSGEEQEWAKDDDDIGIEISVDEQKRKASIDNFGFRRDSFDQSLQPSEMMEIEIPTSLNGKSNVNSSEEVPKNQFEYDLNKINSKNRKLQENANGITTKL